MKIKQITSPLVILFFLIFGSFAFFAGAEERSETTQHIFLDSDQDGLSDEEEKTMGTDPRNADSDKDGYSDGSEVKGGYDPLKPSPGDKLIPDPATPATAVNTEPGEVNMTEEVAQKISTLLSSSDSSDEEITTEQIRSVVNESLSPTFETSAEEFPEVNKEDIKIKKQDFAGLSEEKIAEKKKNDFADYLVGVGYVLSSNSPVPITSTSDTTAIFSDITANVTTAISSRDANSLEKLSEGTEQTLAQLKDVTVPEDLVDTHIKTLRTVEYAQEIKDLLVPNPDDPVADIANLAKIQGFVAYIDSFSEDIAAKFDSYGLTYDDELKSKFSSFGIALPEEDIIEQSNAIDQ